VWDDARVRIGYAYAGGEGREGLEQQLAALRGAGCRDCFADVGPWPDRPELERALAALVDGRDCLVVCRLDRVGRSLTDLIATLAGLEERGVGVCSLQDGIDTDSAGEEARTVFRALAQFERVLPRERTSAVVRELRSGKRRPRLPTGPREMGRTPGMEFAPDLCEPVIGFRHWRLVDGALRSMFSSTAWDEARMTARCAAGRHDPAQTPSPGCTCGIYAYYDPCARTASAMTRDLVGGAVVVWGRLEAHATGMRAEHARIVALALPWTPGPKHRAIARVAAELGLPAVAHRRLRALALSEGQPLPAVLRPPRQRMPAADPWRWLAADRQ
jgi:resolvase-like protein